MTLRTPHNVSKHAITSIELLIFDIAVDLFKNTFLSLGLSLEFEILSATLLHELN